MPLPLLAPPAAYALAAATASSTTTTTLGLGATALGGGWLAWLFWPKSAVISEQHQRSLDEQNKLVLKRIDGANDQVVEVQEAAAAAAVEVAELTQVVGASVIQLQDASGKIQDASQVLLKAGEELHHSTDTMASLTPDLQRLLEKMQQESAKTAEQLDKMMALLQQKDAEMTKAREDINVLSHVVGEQAGLITTLGDTVQVLKAENEAQKTQIVKKDEQLSQYRSAAEIAYKNCQFFKQMANDAKKAAAGEVAQSPILSS